VKSAPAITGSNETNSRPSPEQCQYVVDQLGILHPDVIDECNERKKEADMFSSCGAKESIADGIVSTILSQNTTNGNSTRAFQRLKSSFPTWEDVVALPDDNPKILEDAIRCGGLAKIKAGRIYNIMKTIQEERGKPCLEYLREQTSEQVKENLSRFPGLGPKTISCVLLFTMGRADFPVDTHVHRIAKKIQWVSQSESREGTYDQLNAAIPPEMKLHLHCLLIAHGRQCHRCAARGKPQFPPKAGTKVSCPLVNVPERAAVFAATCKGNW
jgi:endonuclease-3